MGPFRVPIGGPQEGPGPCMGCPIPPFYGPSNGRGRFERSFFDRLSGTETSKSAKRGHFRGYPKWPFLDPIWTPPLLGPLGAPGGGWGHMGTLKAYIGPCRPPYGPLRALIGGPQEGPGPCMGCPIPPFYGPSNGRGRFERSFFDRLSGTETSKSAKRGHFRGYPKWPFLDPIWTPPFGTPWGPWRGVGPYGYP